MAELTQDLKTRLAIANDDLFALGLKQHAQTALLARTRIAVLEQEIERMRSATPVVEK